MPVQRDYFGAHTFRVLPGKENAKFKLGEDIRTCCSRQTLSIITYHRFQTSTGLAVVETSLHPPTPHNHAVRAIRRLTVLEVHLCYPPRCLLAKKGEMYSNNQNDIYLEGCIFVSCSQSLRAH